MSDNKEKEESKEDPKPKLPPGFKIATNSSENGSGKKKPKSSDS